MKKVAIGKVAVKTTNGIINIIVLTAIILVIAYACYALWDSNQIYQAADKSQYEVYKPTEVDEGRSFKELQSLNAEVISWLSVHGTNIDYPVTQGQDNMKYVNTDAEGLYSLSGSIFLDYKNSKVFSDFNSILYGHHMEKKTMFGELGTFSDIDVFNSNLYGNLYFDGKDHGIEFFAFLHTDAYDNSVFKANVVGEDMRQEYLDNLFSKALHKRDIGVTIQDRIVLLSTCSTSSTNGRDILIGRISGEAYEAPAMTVQGDNMNEEPDNEVVECRVTEVPLWAVLLLLASISLLFVFATRLAMDRNNARKKTTSGA